MELEPYRYKEKIIMDNLQIAARVKINEDIWDNLIKIPERENQYFEVIRRGISDEPIEMRFGQFLYSIHDEEIKSRLILVKKSETSDKSWGIFEPELSIIKSELLGNIMGLSELISILTDKGVISESGKDKINDVIKSPKYSNIINTFSLVPDLDDYLEKSKLED